MDTDTWHVAITFAGNGFDLIAKARFADCHVDLVGLGVVALAPEAGPDRATQALAAVRSLESLARELRQVATPAGG